MRKRKEVRENSSLPKEFQLINTEGRLLVSGLACKELGSYALPSKKLNKMKNQHLFLSGREVRSQGKILTQKLERWTDK